MIEKKERALLINYIFYQQNKIRAIVGNSRHTSGRLELEMYNKESNRGLNHRFQITERKSKDEGGKKIVPCLPFVNLFF